MAVTFTPQQQMAIELRGRNILVSAAAGSGKTAVLVERIIQMITNEKEKVDIDRLLVVTFTNAAAAEMRERIRQAIDERLELHPENEHLQKQAALLHNAQITTIDSFCLFIIRNNFNDIGLNPGFRVADEGELKLMKQEVLTELLEQEYGKKEKDFTDCVEYFTGGSNDKLLEEYIEKLYEFSMSNPWPEEWLVERAKDYSITGVSDIEKSQWCQYLVNYVRICLREAVSSLSKAIALAQRPDGPYFYGELFEKEQEMLHQAALEEDFSTLQTAFDTIHFDRLPGKKDSSVNTECREWAKQLRNNVKKQIEGLRESYFSLSLEQVSARMDAAKQPTAVLVGLVLQFKEMFDARKREENIIDFHDMEHLALNILLKKNESGEYETTPAAGEYRQFFHEILTDEYQDSNLVQELLLQSISGEEEGRFNRFMVGDVKQSIYKFRLARPELFIEKYTCYTKHDSSKQRIDLHKNFRSRREVIDSVNSLFYRIMGKDFGGVEYDEDAALYPEAVYPEYENNRTEIILLEKDKESRLSPREQEALVISDKIKKLVREFQVTDKETGRLRPVKYSDIVILLRTTSGWAEDFKGIFEKEGIPAYVTSRTGYFQAAEVRELLGLLHVLNNPLQDLFFYGTMKSFFGGFSEEEIAWIRSRGSKGSFLYENLKDIIQDIKTEETDDGKQMKEKAARFLEQIENWRLKVSYTPIHNLIQDILTETGYGEYVMAKPGGEQRKANVEMLLVRASAFENTCYHGLFHFLRYVEQLEKYQVDYGEADILDENADVVRIMSIHKSKGLEFPVCFIAGLSKKFNMQDAAGRFIADMDMGIGVDYVDSRRRIQSKTLRKNAIAVKLKLDSLSEELRILYVAMTRGKEKLFLTAAVPDIQSLKEELEQNVSWQDEAGIHAGKVPFSVLASAGSYLDFLLPCLLPDEIEWLNCGDIVMSEIEDTLRVSELKQKLLLSEPDDQIVTNLSKKLERHYAYEYLSKLFIKTTVSELKKAGMEHLPEQSIEENNKSAGTDDAFTVRMYEEQEVIPYIPSFIKDKEDMSGTDRGSAYHKVMELLDFKQLSAYPESEKMSWDDVMVEKELKRQLDGMEENKKITSKWRKAVAIPKLAAFLKTDLAKRMMKASQENKLRKEQPFVLGLPADRLNKAFPETEMILIQGIIDVYFEEEDHIVVADYKTDRVKEEGELIKRYQVQLDYYAEALERLTGKQVSEKIIYSFALGREIIIDKTEE